MRASLSSGRSSRICGYAPVRPPRLLRLGAPGRAFAHDFRGTPLVPRLVLLAHPAVASAVSRELGRDLEYHDAIASTQTRARELADAGAMRGIVVANEQTAGQGTRGRTWIAAAGTSLLASWILRPAPAA